MKADKVYLLLALVFLAVAVLLVMRSLSVVRKVRHIDANPGSVVASVAYFEAHADTDSGSDGYYYKVYLSFTAEDGTVVSNAYAYQTSTRPSIKGQIPVKYAMDNPENFYAIGRNNNTGDIILGVILALLSAAVALGAIMQYVRRPR